MKKQAAAVAEQKKKEEEEIEEDIIEAIEDEDKAGNLLSKDDIDGIGASASLGID